jgi:excisionase family DNA binding protein
MGAEIQVKIDAVVVEWARRVPVEQIPSVVAFLFARLVSEGSTSRHSEDNGASAYETKKLLTAVELAGRLGVPESWVRTEERAGRIPSFRLGKYVRFKLSEVERTLAERKREVA